ncbi:MAG: hypothetical protein AAB779_00535 [Patescibacteria group bacterium]
MRKKIIALFSLSVLAFSLTALPALGAGASQDLLDYLDATAQKGGLTDAPAQDSDVMQIVAGIISTVLGLTGIIFFAQMFYHGFRWMTAAGNDSIITESKSGIKQSIIGIVIVFSSFIASNFVINRIERINKQATTPAATTSPVAQP